MTKKCINGRPTSAAARRLVRCLVASLLLLGLGRTAAEEVIYLQSGEEYRGFLQAIDDEANVLFRIGDEERTFPMSAVERIEFERPREYHDCSSAEQLKKASPVFAQALAVSTEQLKARYPNASAVVLSRKRTYRVSADGAWESTSWEIRRILTEKGKSAAFGTVHFFPDRETAEVLHGLTILPDGSVSHLSDAALKDEALYGRKPTYDHMHRLRYTLKGATVGATLSVKSKVNGKADALNPFHQQFFFGGEEPILNARVELVQEGGECVRFTECNGLGAAKVEENGARLAWEVAESPQILPEPMMPPYGCFVPMLVLTSPAGTWEELAAEYAKARRAQAKAGGPALSKMLEDCRKSAAGKTPAQLARAAYDTVRTGVKIESVPPGRLPVVQSPPAEVAARGYGTQIEKAFLLGALLDGLGVKNRPYMTRSRNAGPLTASVPSLRAFSAVLVCIETEDGEQWLMPDDERTGYGEIRNDLQGADAISLVDGSACRVPVRECACESLETEYVVRLSADGSAATTETVKATGNHARGYRGLKEMTAEELKTRLTEEVASRLPGAELLELSHSDFTKAEPVVSLSRSYRAPGCAQSVGDFLLMQLPVPQFSPSQVGRPSRRLGLFWDGIACTGTKVSVIVPEGYEVYCLPDGVLHRDKGWSYTASYEVNAEDARRVEFTEEYRRTALNAVTRDYASLRKTLISRALVQRQWLVFRKTRTAQAH